MAEDSPKTDSIFDYLYIDHVRISSFLGQLTNYGHLEKVAVEDKVESVSSSKNEMGVNAVGQFKVGFDRSDKTVSGATRTYDALWINARSILDVLEGAGLIQRDLGQAELGNLIVVSGTLSITDLRIMRPIWGPMLELFGDQIELPESLNVSRQVRRAAKRKGQGPSGQTKPSPQDTFKEVIATFFEGMPHAVQGTIHGTESVWFTMGPDRMSQSPEELALQHGEIVPGTWHAIGIVDALPGQVDDDAEEAVGASAVIRPMMAQVRDQFGRPSTSFGITPLMIFRKLNTQAG